jgi:hypothetical protein
LIISAGPKSWVNRNILSGGAMVWIGLISYPLYLWHWPLLSFARVISGKAPTPLVAAVLVLASICLAAMTFLWVERPIRRSSPAPAKAIALVAMLCMMGGAGYSIAASSGFPSRHENAERIFEASRDWRSPDLNATYHGLPAWTAGSGVGDDVLFIGDSQMQQYFPRLKSLSEIAAGGGGARRLVMLTQTGCAPYPGIFRQLDPASVTTGLGCGRFLQKMLPLIEDASVKVVVFAGAWYAPLTDPLFFVKLNGQDRQLVASEDARDQVFSNFGSLIRSLVSAGKKVFVITDIPLGIGPLEMLPVGWARLSGQPHVPAAMPRRLMEQTMGAWVDMRLGKVARESGAVVINPLDFLCDEACPVVSTDGRPRYMDAHHLRGSFVRDSVRYLDATVD